MKLNKKILGLFMAGLMLVCNMSTVFAAGEENLTPMEIDEIH